MKFDEAIHGLTEVAKIVDDLLIWGEGETAEEAVSDHDSNFDALLTCARCRNIKLNPEKF